MISTVTILPNTNTGKMITGNQNGKPNSSRKTKPHERIKINRDALTVAHTKSIATLVRVNSVWWPLAMAKHLQPKPTSQGN